MKHFLTAAAVAAALATSAFTAASAQTLASYDEVVTIDGFPRWSALDMTEAEKESMIALIESNSGKKAKRIQLLHGADLSEAVPNLTDAEAAAIESYMPGADLRILNTSQVKALRAALQLDDDTQRVTMISSILG